MNNNNNVQNLMQPLQQFYRHIEVFLQYSQRNRYRISINFFYHCVSHLKCNGAQFGGSFSRSFLDFVKMSRHFWRFNKITSRMQLQYHVMSRFHQDFARTFLTLTCLKKRQCKSTLLRNLIKMFTLCLQSCALLGMYLVYLLSFFIVLSQNYNHGTFLFYC